MRKLLFMLTLTLGLVFTSQAQIVLQGTYTNTNGLDTVVNTGTYYLKTKAGDLTSVGLAGNYVIQLISTNISGTSTITAVLESSLDGTNWSNHFMTPGTDGVNCDTLAISAAGTHIWTAKTGASKSKFYAAGVENVFFSNAGRRLYFRVKLVGGATQTTQVKARLITQN